MNSRLRVIAPGETLGVFGGGQLGRMFTHAAQRLGYRVIVFTDEIDSPAGQVAQETIQADYLDPDAVRMFAERVAVITLEFENIALEAVARAAEITLVRPGVPHFCRSHNIVSTKKGLSRTQGFQSLRFMKFGRTRILGRHLLNSVGHWSSRL